MTLSRPVKRDTDVASKSTSSFTTSGTPHNILCSVFCVHFKMGELNKAIEQYERIQALTLGRFGYGDIYAKIQDLNL